MVRLDEFHGKVQAHTDGVGGEGSLHEAAEEFLLLVLWHTESVVSDLYAQCVVIVLLYVERDIPPAGVYFMALEIRL